jgi:hypothetical protein
MAKKRKNQGALPEVASQYHFTEYDSSTVDPPDVNWDVPFANASVARFREDVIAQLKRESNIDPKLHRRVGLLKRQWNGHKKNSWVVAAGSPPGVLQSEKVEGKFVVAAEQFEKWPLALE